MKVYANDPVYIRVHSENEETISEMIHFAELWDVPFKAIYPKDGSATSICIEMQFQLGDIIKEFLKKYNKSLSGKATTVHAALDPTVT